MNEIASRGIATPARSDGSIPGGLSIDEVTAIAAYVAIMTLVCLLACVVPVRRALAVDPIEALRAD